MVLAGDQRLTERLKTPELVPLGTRIRTRLALETSTKNDLLTLLREIMTRAGNPKLMTEGLIETLAEHSAGNPRILMSLAADVLSLATKKESPTLDESLYLDAFPPPTRQAPKKNAPANR